MSESLYTPEIVESANDRPVLGAEYFVARDAAARFLAHWQEEHAKQLADAIIKPVMDAVYDKVWDAFRDHLLSDAETNVADTMRRMVEDSVRALIGGDKWANIKYIETKYRDGQKVRETLAKLHSDTIKDGRIADLEKQVAGLKEQLQWARGDR